MHKVIFYQMPTLLPTINTNNWVPAWMSQKISKLRIAYAQCNEIAKAQFSPWNIY